MCPNCVLNGMGLGTGYFFVFFICIMFLGVGAGWIVWGFKSGAFKDLEGSVKMNVIEDDFKPAGQN